jgi:tetratricopeptide (TPR) repeat protein
MGYFHKAKTHAETAVALDPVDAENIRISVEVKRLVERENWQAWLRVQQLESALALEPNNAHLHESLGTIYLYELDRPREAEICLREALRLDPRDRDRQRLLFKAVGQQRLIYRVISLPSRAFARLKLIVKYIVKEKPGAIFWFIVGYKFVALALVWLASVTVVFWPAAKVYEWLLLEETRSGADTKLWHLRVKRFFTRWPFTLRFGVFAVVICAFWIILFRQYFDTWKKSFFALSVFVGVHFLATGLSVAVKAARSALGRRKANLDLAPSRRFDCRV